MDLKLKLHEVLAPKNFATYWENTYRDQDEPYMGLSLFPTKFTNQLTIEQIKGKKGVPVTLAPSAYDARPTLRDKIGVTGQYMNIPFFREAMHLTEKEKQDLVTLMNSNLTSEGLQYMLANIYDQLTPLIEGAEAQKERMAMSILARGTIYIASDGAKGTQVAYQYNYDFDDEWKTNNITTLTGTDTWEVVNASTATPIQDILDLMDNALETKGVNLTRAILTTATLNKIIAMDEVKEAMQPLYADRTLPFNKAQKVEFLERMTGIKFYPYDKRFRSAEDGVDTKFYPDDQVTFLPDGAIGNMMVGNTPDSFDDMVGLANVKTAKLSSGVTLASYGEGVPYKMTTTVSMVALPSVNDLDEIFIIKKGA